MDKQFCGVKFMKILETITSWSVEVKSKNDFAISNTYHDSTVNKSSHK